MLLLHGPSEPFGYEGGCNAQVCELNRAQWAAYTAALASGQARAIGVSNYCQSCLKCLQEDTTARGNEHNDTLGSGAGSEHNNTLGVTSGAGGALNTRAAVAPAVNQIQHHVGMGPDPESLLSYCDEQGIVVQVKTHS